MARSNAVRLTFAIGGLAAWCCAAATPLAAAADDAGALTALNQRLVDIASTNNPGNRAQPTSFGAAPRTPPTAQKPGKPFKPFPGLVDRFNQVDRFMHLRSADGNLDANLWGAFAGGRGMSVKYHIVLR